MTTTHLGLILILVSLGLCSLATLSLQAQNSTRQYKLVTSWGNDKMRVLNPDPKTWERSLLDTCTQTNYVEFIHIYGVITAFADKQMPGMDLSQHCLTPYPGYTPSAPTNTALLSCPEIGQHIKACQQLGKKILITLVNTQSPMSTDAQGEQLALNMWNIFLGGDRSSPRPFGSDVVLDGVDVMVRDGVYGYTAFVRKMKQLMDADSSKKYYISGSPRCSFPDAMFGPTYANLPLTVLPNTFDYLSIYCTSSPDCSFLNKDLFYSTLQKWSDWATTANPSMQLYVALPANTYLTAPGDYIEASSVISNNVTSRLTSSYPNFAGINLWESSSDWNNKVCASVNSTDVYESTNTYGQMLYKLMNSNAPVTKLSDVITCPTANSPSPSPSASASQSANPSGDSNANPSKSDSVSLHASTVLLFVVLLLGFCFDA